MPEDTNTAQAAEVPATAPTPESAQAAKPETPITAPALDADVQETEGQEIDSTDPKAIDKFKRREQRLRGERNSAREEAEASRQKITELEGQVAEQQSTETQAQINAVAAERDAAKTELDALKAERTTEKRTAALDGKVSDVKMALKVLDDSHLKADGTVDTDKLYADYPALKPAEIKTVPNAPDGGGGSQQRGTVPVVDVQAAVTSKDPAQINAAFEQRRAQRQS